MAEKGIRAVHTINPADITFNGDKALSESVGHIENLFEENNVTYEICSVLRFVSRLQKTARGWRILTFEAIYDYEKITPILPRTNESLEISLKGRNSYACLAWLLAKGGYNISQSLPGMDRPDLVEKCMKVHLEWLGE